MVREVLASPARLERLLDRFRRGHLPLVLDLVRDGFTSGVFRGDVPVGLLLAAVGALGGPAQLLLGAMEGRLPPALVPRADGRSAALVDLLLHGVGAAGPLSPTLSPLRGARGPDSRSSSLSRPRERAGERASRLRQLRD